MNHYKDKSIEQVWSFPVGFFVGSSPRWWEMCMFFFVPVVSVF